MPMLKPSGRWRLAISSRPRSMAAVRAAFSSAVASNQVGHVPSRDEEQVAFAHREGVPEGPRQAVFEGDAVLGGEAEGALGGCRHGVVFGLLALRVISGLPSRPAAMQAGHRQTLHRVASCRRNRPTVMSVDAIRPAVAGVSLSGWFCSSRADSDLGCPVRRGTLRAERLCEPGRCPVAGREREWKRKR